MPAWVLPVGALSRGPCRSQGRHCSLLPHKGTALARRGRAPPKSAGDARCSCRGPSGLGRGGADCGARRGTPPRPGHRGTPRDSLAATSAIRRTALALALGWPPIQALARSPLATRAGRRARTRCPLAAPFAAVVMPRPLRRAIPLPRSHLDLRSGHRTERETSASRERAAARRMSAATLPRRLSGTRIARRWRTTPSTTPVASSSA